MINMTKPIRVLQVVGRMDRGGIETLIMNIYRNIDRTKIQFDFLCHYGEEAEYNEEIRSLGGKIYEMPQIKTTSRTYYHRFFQYYRALNRFFSEHREYNVVHGHMTNTASVYMPVAKRHGVRCCIAHSHLTQARQGLTGMVTNILQIPLEKVADEYFSCSEMASKWLYSKRTISSNKVKIINNAIESEKYDYNPDTRAKVRESLGVEDKFVVGHVGRFFPQKNHEYLIDIFNEITQIDSNATLLLIGEGVLKTQIENKVKKLGLGSSVRFLGTRSDVPELMQAMDVFVMPSHFEGLPLVGVEAQAAGLRCVLSDEITKELAITDNVSYLSLSQRPEDWAEFILAGRDTYVRKSTNKTITQAGYNIKANVDWLETFYLKKHYGEEQNLLQMK